MNRVLKFLARLYPSEWRNRYGAEYEALLEEGTPRVRDAVDVLWSAVKMQVTSRSFVRIVLPCTLAGMFAAVIISVVAPPEYVSQTTILMRSGVDSGVCGDQTDLPADLQGAKPGLCVYQHDFGYYQRFLDGGGFSRGFLASVIMENNLYSHTRTQSSTESAIDEMQKNIHVRSTSHESRFVLEFNYPDAHVAQRVNNELVSYLDYRVQQEIRSDFLGSMLKLPNNLNSAARKQLEKMTLEQHAPFDPATQMLHLAALPQGPSGLSRIQLGLIGLFGGLFCGLIVAAILRSRHGANDYVG
jgi:uncharacterized protein involved in exopolysaccharide biosynthesis